MRPDLLTRRPAQVGVDHHRHQLTDAGRPSKLAALARLPSSLTLPAEKLRIDDDVLR
jgi:hypothetical protein